MLNEKDYCDYDTYIALEELGYPEVMAFNKPFLLYEAQKWLREEKQIEVVVLSRGMIGKPYCYQIYEEDSVTADDRDYDIYEEALLEGVKAAVNILKEEK